MKKNINNKIGFFRTYFSMPKLNRIDIIELGRGYLGVALMTW